MISFVFRTGSLACVVLLNVFAIFLLLRGHNLPGGGFVAGAASGVSLIILSMNFGVQHVRDSLKIDPVSLVALGLVISFVVAIAPLFFGYSFLEHFHFPIKGWGALENLPLGTPILFEIGIYAIVVGIVSKITFIMMNSSRGLTPFSEDEMKRFGHSHEVPVVDQEVAAADQELPYERREAPP